MVICRQKSFLPSGFDITEVDMLISEGFAEADGVTVNGDDICFMFSSNVDEGAVDSVLTGHTPGELELRIFRFDDGSFDKYEPPLNFDFGLLDLEKEKVLNFGDHGDVKLLNYYDGFDPATGYGDLIAKREFSLTYNTSPILRIEVIETLKWMRNNGSECPVTKTITRNYVGKRWTDFLEGKRKQIIEWLRHWIMTSMFYLQGQFGIPVGSSNVMAFGSAWFTSHATAINSYIVSYDVVNLLAEIAADPAAWLDAAIPDTVGVPGLPTGTTFRQMMNAEILY